MAYNDPRDIRGHGYYHPPTYYPFWQPPVIPWGPAYPTTIPVVKYNFCPHCGIKLDEIMGYVCNKQRCPVFPQVTCELK